MNIIELAKQAGFQDADWNYIKGLARFAALVAAHEREECAKLCEEPGWNAANWCAKAIRARSNT
jgi:hypothetical protein